MVPPESANRGESLAKKLEALLEYHRACAVYFANTKPDPKRKEAHDGYEATIREALAAIGRREKRAAAGAIVPPTLAELMHYGQGKGLPENECVSCFQHYTLTEWTYGRAKHPLRKWQVAVDRWLNKWRQDNPGKVRAQQTLAITQGTASAKNGGDPDGWRDFLRGLQKGYEPFAHARGWMKNRFAEQQKQK